MHGLQSLQSGITKRTLDLEAVTIHVDIWNVGYKTYNFCTFLSRLNVILHERMNSSMSHACGKVTGGTHTRRASNVGEAQIATSGRVGPACARGVDHNVGLMRP